MSGLTAEQIEERAGPDGFVGASEIAAIAGISRFGAPIDVWLRKTGRVAEDSSPRAAVGLRAEQTIAQWYCEDTGIDPVNLRGSGSIRHPAFRHVGCTPDRLVARGGDIVSALQIKCVGARMSMAWPDPEQITAAPPDVICQVQYELEIMNALWGLESQDLVAWLGGTDFRIRTVKRDPELTSMLLEAAHDFWPYVTNDEPPPVDGSESWRVYLRKLFPMKERVVLTAPEYADDWARQWMRGRVLITEGKKLQRESGNHLKSLINTNYGIMGEDWIATWSAGENRKFEVKERSQ